MKICLDYHRGGLEVEVPGRNVAGVIETPPEPVAPAPDEIIRRALSAPIGSPPLREIARDRRSACIVIPDVTRPMPVRVVLPRVLCAVEEAGLPGDAVTILIATGLHRPNEGAELEEMIGAEVMRDYRIENHVARDKAGHVYLGVTSSGVPVNVDRRYLAADLKVLLGLVEPHFMAGFSGGRKLVCPGVCSEETINAFHGPELIEHPLSANCVLDGNPTHLTSTEVAQRAGVDFTLNVVLNSQRRLVAAFAGDLTRAFHAAAERARASTTVFIKAPADIVVVTGGGYPLDATWYQSIKGLVAAIPAVRKGGTVIQAAALAEGIGSADFTRLMEETSDLGVFMQRIREPGFFRNEQWELEEFVRVARHAQILLYSDGLPREVQERLFVTPVCSVEAGITQALARHGKDAGILFMPHGPYVLALPDAKSDR